ncbi:MAG: hypothetical protein M1608_00580 [Candidatus Omnitrophica bacterium]|nr:hypothetical protein [Candidatus Omnitrophota bacterium]
MPHTTRATIESARSVRSSPGSGSIACFTLVELLVVFALISLLAGLLLPVLSRGKMTAQRIQCLGNLRQLSLATQMYWDDNSGNAFSYRLGSTNGGDLYWFGWLARGIEGERAFDRSQGILFPYLGAFGVEVCPSLDYSFAQFKLKASGASYGYGYNLCLSSVPSQPAVKISRITRLSTTALFADAAQVNTFQAPASPDHPMLEEFYYLSTNEATTHFRHQQKANVAFCDGHADLEKPATGSLDPRLPNQWIGRLRPEILVVP